MLRPLLALALLLGPLAVPVRAHLPIDAELKRLYEADQADRKLFELPPSEWTLERTRGLRDRDAARRARVHQLLAEGRPARPEAWFHAALVYQHGDRPADYLFAHQLAAVAAFDGHKPARWLAAASLDRYLNAIGRPQVFGTQYHQSGSEPFTMEPYDRTMPAAVREAFRVPPLAETERRLADLNADRASTAPEPAK